MQRLTKYGLLLTAIRKHITDENDGEVIDSMVSVLYINKNNQLSLRYTTLMEHNIVCQFICYSTIILDFTFYREFLLGNKNYCRNNSVRKIYMYGYG